MSEYSPDDLLREKAARIVILQIEAEGVLTVAQLRFALDSIAMGRPVRFSTSAQGDRRVIRESN